MYDTRGKRNDNVQRLIDRVHTEYENAQDEPGLSKKGLISKKEPRNMLSGKKNSRLTQASKTL
jgi:hypothetical protein